MPRLALLLRGVNLGPNNRVPMAGLRELLGTAGYGEVQTYLQSGNVVLMTEQGPADVAGHCSRLIASRFGLRIAVLARTAPELAAVLAGDPLGALVDNPRRYQVTFLAETLGPEIVTRLQHAAAPGERVVVRGLHVYAWTPEGIARSRLWTLLADPSIGTVATARNWTTVNALHRLAAA